MFLSGAHTEADIDRVLEAADAAFSEMTRRGSSAA
jgi:glutamate-1-semialdehyde aminotransferase